MKVNSALKKRSPFLVFIPHLVVYLLLVLYFSQPSLRGDEERYLQFAQNLKNGFYSPPPPDINLWNGPGYPLLLLPVIALDLPLITIKLLNAVLLYLSAGFLLLTLRKLLSPKPAFLIALFFASYYPFFEILPLILTEAPAILLTTLFCYFLLKIPDRYSWRQLLPAGLCMGYLALTKIIFGYVILAALGISGLLFLFKRSPNHHAAVKILLVALAINLPWLGYTWQLTGKWFYWGNSGGMSLYWMSSPYRGEYGDWNNTDFDANCYNIAIQPCQDELLEKNHKADIDYILSLPPSKRDDAYRRKALENMLDHPWKFLENCWHNISRLLFGMPASYHYQTSKTLLRILPNAIVLTFMLIAAFLSLRNWKIISFPIKLLLLLSGLYLAACIPLSAYPRFFYPVLSPILLWIGVSLHQNIRIVPLKETP